MIGKYVILGVAAVWDARKGLKDFELLNKKISENYKIIIVGLTGKQKNALQKNIIGINRTSNTMELSGLYSIADVFVNPTYEDNYPTTNLEAISCGAPVITYDTGGSPESAKAHGKSVERGNIKKLLEAINNSKLSTTEIKSDKFDKKITINKYLEIYE